MDRICRILAEAHREIEALFHDCREDVDTDSDPDLCLHCVLGCAIERLDSQVLFDPSEEELDLPATLVEFSYGISIK